LRVHAVYLLLPHRMYEVAIDIISHHSDWSLPFLLLKVLAAWSFSAYVLRVYMFVRVLTDRTNACVVVTSFVFT
jgi:hypothetical protein